jgi:hypothetical protein
MPPPYRAMECSCDSILASAKKGGALPTDRQSPQAHAKPSASRASFETLKTEQIAREVSEPKRTARGTGLTRRRSRWRLRVGSEFLFDHLYRIERASSLPSAVGDRRIGGRFRRAPISQQRCRHSSDAVRERRHVGGPCVTRHAAALHCVASRSRRRFPPRSHRTRAGPRRRAPRIRPPPDPTVTTVPQPGSLRAPAPSAALPGRNQPLAATFLQ